MESMGPLSWAIIVGILFVLPLWRINERVGLNPWNALFALIPYAGLPIALGILAFKDWPNGAGHISGPFDEIERLKEKF
jgi:hypothetical protein